MEFQIGKKELIPRLLNSAYRSRSRRVAKDAVFIYRAYGFPTGHRVFSLETEQREKKEKKKEKIVRLLVSHAKFPIKRIFQL